MLYIILGLLVVLVLVVILTKKKITDFRISKINRYAGNITSPIEPYTKLMLYFNGDDNCLRLPDENG